MEHLIVEHVTIALVQLREADEGPSEHFESGVTQVVEIACHTENCLTYRS